VVIAAAPRVVLAPVIEAPVIEAPVVALVIVVLVIVVAPVTGVALVIVAVPGTVADLARHLLGRSLGRPTSLLVAPAAVRAPGPKVKTPLHFAELPSVQERKRD